VEDFLGFSNKSLKKLGAFHTAREIESQPQMWRETYRRLMSEKEELEDYLNHINQYSGLAIILTGAGTSAFIGEVLEGPWQFQTGKISRAIATTDIVTHPHLYFHKEVPTLLISFARSGNSPESVKAVELVNQICDTSFNLIVTCNEEGSLARAAEPVRDYVFLLPPETNDRSLAMTSSFSSMVLAGLLISRISELEQLKSVVDQTARYARTILSEYLQAIKRIGVLPFKRAVFLGSGLFQGIAHEAHLKLQELSDGAVICKYDSFLGFRHGPKAVIDKDTLLVFLFSNAAYASQYENDLVNAINDGENGLFRLGIMESDLPLELDLKIVLGKNDPKLDETFLALVSVVPAQMIGFFKSLNLNLKPDAPSESGTITRVVQGVRIYPYQSTLELEMAGS